MKLRYYLRLLRGKTKALKPAKLTWANIKAVIQSWFRQKCMVIDGFQLPSHTYEQIIWRRTEVQKTSPECWNDGTCKVCGCEILGKTMEDRGCEAPAVLLPQCYPDMMEKEKWEQYKIDNNIKLFS